MAADNNAVAVGRSFSFYMWRSKVTVQTTSSGYGIAVLAVAATTGVASATMKNLTVAAAYSNVTILTGSQGNGVSIFGVANQAGAAGSATGMTGLAVFSNFTLACRQASGWASVGGTNGTSTGTDILLESCSSTMVGISVPSGTIAVASTSADQCRNCVVRDLGTGGSCVLPPFPSFDTALAELNATTTMLLDCLSHPSAYTASITLTASTSATTSATTSRSASASDSGPTISASGPTASDTPSASSSASRPPTRTRTVSRSAKSCTVSTTVTASASESASATPSTSTTPSISDFSTTPSVSTTPDTTKSLASSSRTATSELTLSASAQRTLTVTLTPSLTATPLIAAPGHQRAPNEVAAVTDAVAASTSVLVAVSMGNPAVASQGSRLGSLRLTIDCRERATQLLGASDGLPAPPSGFDAHPLGFSVAISGNDSVNEHGGAVVGNVAIIGAFALLFLVLAASRSAWKGRTLAQGMAWTRYPACIVFPVALLLQPIVLSSTVLIAWGGDGVALGATGLLLSCLLVATGTAAYVRQFSSTFTFRRQVPTQRNGQFLRLVSWLMSEKGEWVPACAKAATASVQQNTTTALNETADEPKLDTTELRRFGVLFDPYDERFAWFLAVEMGYNVLQGIACGLQMTLGCAWSAWLVAALSIVFFLSITVLQPHGRRLDVALQALLAFLQALGAVLASVAIGTEDNALAVAFPMRPKTRCPLPPWRRRSSAFTKC
jgi:hypothetical protein